MLTQTTGIILLEEKQPVTLYKQTQVTHIMPPTADATWQFERLVLDPQSDWQFSVAANSTLWILPFIGDVVVEISGEKYPVEEDHVWQQGCTAEQLIRLQNAYTEEAIQCYALIGEGCSDHKRTIQNLDFSTQKNQLIALHTQAKVWIGQYRGRAEDTYQLQETNKQVWVYVLQGVFEVQNRLLHAQDALYLWDLEAVEFEALSQNAMILLIDC